ncbi:MAG TPA: (2Fe-2S)-binding protein [Phenylobacterium sp.]|nr:(2Fe-2S)-binding protein [Phenylobacterium sp.]
MAMTLDVNGKPVTVNAAPDTPLLWVLRDELHLTGSKYGCGIGQCGACTVLADGSPIRSCSMPISGLAGIKISTVESLGGNHPLQQAWVANDVPQCGYCQSGQLMSAAALLAAKPHPTDEDIDAAMDGNICRCGTYQRVRKAIKDAAAAPAPAAAAPAAQTTPTPTPAG